MKTYLFSLCGEDLGTMAADEAVSVIRTETGSEPSGLATGPGWLSASVDERHIDAIASRLALTKEIGELLYMFDPSDPRPPADVSIPEGSFAVRAFRFEGAMKDVDSQRLCGKVGAYFQTTNPVDLRSPDITLRLMMSDICILYVLRYSLEAGPLRARKVSERPFFSPISLHPKYARALINLTGVKRGGRVLDPFCGTGGIVIEAASMGMRTYASDFDPEMVDGTMENLDHFGLPPAECTVCDVQDIAEHFSGIDAVCCDPPYGRAAKTGGEKIGEIYRRAAEATLEVLSDGGAVGFVLPGRYVFDGLRLESCYVQYVHGTLNRYYHIFRPERQRYVH